MWTENENIILGEDISDIRDRGEYCYICCSGERLYKGYFKRRGSCKDSRA